MGVKKYQTWSNGKIFDWIGSSVEKVVHKSGGRAKVIDFGCGLGVSAAALLNSFKSKISYLGVDIFPLDKTASFLAEQEFNDITLQVKNMADDQWPNEYDLALALGSLHHTPSVEKSIVNTSKVLRDGGRYIGWVINKQTPLRQATDKVFRDHYSQLENDEKKWEEARRHAYISWRIAEALGDQTITLKEDVPSWCLSKGTYKIQTLLFDYLIKISKDESLERSAHQAYDWFVPQYYHQTDRTELLSILERLNVSNIEVITKTNGHCFSFTK
jgi:SAM-dependent methyltransferase